jgi:hypothetical protein
MKARSCNTTNEAGSRPAISLHAHDRLGGTIKNIDSCKAFIVGHTLADSAHKQSHDDKSSHCFDACPTAPAAPRDRPAGHKASKLSGSITHIVPFFFRFGCTRFAFSRPDLIAVLIVETGMPLDSRPWHRQDEATPYLGSVFKDATP